MGMPAVTDEPDLRTISREGGALRRLERSVDRIRRLEVEITLAFNELQEALANCREQGIECQVQLGKTVDAARVAWEIER
jgi:uncharacterized protein (UPF0335 family)